jgi:signal transduction histidine kinase
LQGTVAAECDILPRDMPMRISETPFSADWLAISARWMVMLGLVLALALGGGLVIERAWPLGLLLGWNVIMTILAGENGRLPFHRQLNVVVDVLLCAALLWAQGGPAGPAAWAGLLPILTAALYFEFLGALLVAILVAALGLLTAWPRLGSQLPLALIWPLGVVGLGGLAGLLGSLVVGRLRKKRRSWLAAEDAQHRGERERLRAIYELSASLTATLSYRRVLDSALDMSFAALKPDVTEAAADMLVGSVLLFRGGKLRVGAARRFTTADERVSLEGADGILKKVFDQGESVLSRNVASDPELGRLIALRACRSSYCLPLRSGFNVYGAMLFAHSDPAFFTPVRRGLLDIIGGQASIALHNARLYQDLVEEKERMVEVNEEARRKLARDLHDGPTQSVAAMAMRLSIVRRMLESDPVGAGEELTRIEELALRAGKEIRHTLFTLRPLVLESQGLVAALNALAEKMRETFGQNVIVDADEQVADAIEAAKQGILFYIIEEAMNNARKHANAANIWVRLRSHQPGVAVLEVQDDGVGFDVAQVSHAYDRRSSLGLLNMRERAELVNGMLSIESAAGRGTKVSVILPLTREAADRLGQAVPS